MAPLPAGASPQSPAAVYLAGLAPGSRPTQAAALEVAARELSGARLAAEEIPWHRLRAEHVLALRARLNTRYAPATVNRMLCAVRGVLRHAFLLRQVGGEDWQRANEVRGVRGSRLPPGRALSPAELERLFRAAAAGAPPERAARDEAILAVLFAGGLRRAELVGLQRERVRPEELAGGARGFRLEVLGKGNKVRACFLAGGAAAAMDAWLSVRGPEPGPLFHRLCRSPRGPRGLTPQAVLWTCRELAEAAGVARFSPHDLRRTFISALLDSGRDLATVQAAAGHATPATTARYDRRGERSRQEAAGALVVPFVPVPGLPTSSPELARARDEQAPKERSTPLPSTIETGRKIQKQEGAVEKRTETSSKPVWRRG